MSAYSEWKFGLITDAEYAAACREEEFTSRYWDEHPDEFNDDDPDQDDEEFDESEVFIDDDIDEF